MALEQPVRAVFWDVGGVIMRTEDRNPRQHLAERLGRTSRELEYLVFASPPGVAVQRGALDIASLWRYVLDELGLPSEELPAVQDGFWGGDRVDYELVEFIRSLRPRCKTGVISNGWSSLRRTMTDEWQIIDAFDDLVVSAEVGLLKPNPDIYQLALQRLDVRPGEAVFVDDFSENIEAAHRLGMHTVHFYSRKQTVDALQTLLGERTS